VIPYLLDTDITNYLIRGGPSVLARYRAAVLAGSEFVLSPIVHFEVSRYLRLRGARRLQRTYDELIAEWMPVELTPEAWDLAIDLWARRRRVGRRIVDAELLIAVTVLTAGAVLVTHNAAHYAGLGLTMETRCAG